MPGAVAGMRAAEPCRDQHLDPLADQFGAVIPEQGLHLRVDEPDQAWPRPRSPWRPAPIQAARGTTARRHRLRPPTPSFHPRVPCRQAYRRAPPGRQRHPAHHPGRAQTGARPRDLCINKCTPGRTMLIPIIRSGQGPKSCQNENPATNGYGEKRLRRDDYPAGREQIRTGKQSAGRGRPEGLWRRSPSGLGSHPNGVMTAHPVRGLPVIMRSWRGRTPRRFPEIQRFSHRPDSSAGWSMRYEHLSADRRLRILVGLREQLPGGSGRFYRVAQPAPAGLAERVRRAAGPQRRELPVRARSNAIVPDHRRYVPGTMVLETTWHTPTGWLVVNDMFVVRPVSDEGRRAGYERVPRVGAGVGTILRTATCISGKVDVTANCLPMFDYGSAPSLLELRHRQLPLVGDPPARRGRIPATALQLPARPDRGPRLRPGHPQRGRVGLHVPHLGGPAPTAWKRRTTTRRHHQLLAGLAQHRDVSGPPVAAIPRAQRADPEGPELRADRGDHGRRRRPVCLRPRAGHATGTTATPGSGTPGSPCAPSTGSATTGRRWSTSPSSWSRPGEGHQQALLRAADHVRDRR